MVDVFKEEGDAFVEILLDTNDKYFIELERVQEAHFVPYIAAASSGSVFGALGDEGGLGIVIGGLGFIILVVAIINWRKGACKCNSCYISEDGSLVIERHAALERDGSSSTFEPNYEVEDIQGYSINAESPQILTSTGVGVDTERRSVYSSLDTDRIAPKQSVTSLASPLLREGNNRLSGYPSLNADGITPRQSVTPLMKPTARREPGYSVVV